MTDIIQRLRWHSNPFEPSASGAPLLGDIVLSPSLIANTETVLDSHEIGRGPKVVVVVGEYGIGKSSLLQWMLRKWFPPRTLIPFYFDNPGVQFYDLANRLLRVIGRKNFAKFIWELAGSHVDTPIQRDLFRGGFEEYLITASRRKRSVDITQPLQEAILAAEITHDEQIAHCLAKIVTGIAITPYFSYHDFLPRHKNSIVAEREEAPYFTAVLNTIRRGTGALGIAFLIDEFEEIGLQKRLTKRAAHDYLATLKRLINLAQSTDIEFWLILSMTPDSYDITAALEPGFQDRIAGRLEVPPLSADDAMRVMRERILAARRQDDLGEDKDAIVDLFPFPSDMAFRPSTYSNPRRLVKACFRALAQATPDQDLPLTASYLRGVEDALYGEEGERHV